MLENYIRTFNHILNKIKDADSIIRKQMLIEELDSLYFRVFQAGDEALEKNLSDLEARNLIDLETAIAVLKERLAGELDKQ